MNIIRIPAAGLPTSGNFGDVARGPLMTPICEHVAPDEVYCSRNATVLLMLAGATNVRHGYPLCEAHARESVRALFDGAHAIGLVDVGIEVKP